MAADNQVNGITKIEREGVFIYSFPLGTITANNSNNTVTYELITPAIRNETVSFDDITDKKGATTPEEYVDQLATDGIFFSPDSDSGDITGTVSVDNFPNPQNVDVGNFPDPQNVNPQQGGNDLSVTNPLPVSLQPELSVVYTAFGRLRTAQEQKKLEISAIDGKQPLFMNEEIIVGGSSVAANSVVTMTVNAANQVIIRQSKQRAVYQKGNSQEVFLTFDNMQAETNVEKRVGYFTSSTASPYIATRDGVFLYSDGTNINIVLANDGAETVIPQAVWNIDNFGGGGISGITLDFSQRNIMVASMEWLGVGIVAVGFNVDGVTRLAHVFYNANNGTGVYMLSASKPIRWEIRSLGAFVGSTYLTQICGSVASEGAQNQLGKVRSTEAQNFQANNAGDLYAVQGIRIQSGKDYTQIDLKRISALASTNDDFVAYVMFNPIVTNQNAFTPEFESVIESTIGNGGGGRVFSSYRHRCNNRDFTWSRRSFGSI